MVISKQNHGVSKSPLAFNIAVIILGLLVGGIGTLFLGVMYPTTTEFHFLTDEMNQARLGFAVYSTATTERIFLISGLIIIMGPAIASTILLAPLLLLVMKKQWSNIPPWKPVINYSLSAIFGAVFAIVTLIAVVFLFSFDTEYAPGYSESAFRTVNIGTTEEEVLRLLGEPLQVRETAPYIWWLYSDQAQPNFETDGYASGNYTRIWFNQAGLVERIFGQLTAGNSIFVGGGNNYLQLSDATIESLKGKTRPEIQELYGLPTSIYESKATKVLVYSRSPSSSNYMLRTIGIDAQEQVTHIQRKIYWD
jgi:hypothetical protein